MLGIMRQRSRQRRCSIHGSARRRLLVETLEDRRLLAQISWDGGGGSLSWNDPLNWDLDRLPSRDDSVVIPSGFTGIEADQLSAAVTSLSVGSRSDLTWSGGALAITEDSTIDGGLLVASGGLLTLDSMKLTGEGNLINQAAISLRASSIDLDFDNRGAVTVFHGAGSTINGPLTTNADSVIRLQSDPLTSAFLTVADGFTNSGRIELRKDGVRDESSVLTVSNGVLTNAAGAVIQSGGGSGSHVLDAEVLNLGTIDVDQNLLLDNEARVFTTTAGTLDVAFGERFEIRKGSTEIGSETKLVGEGSVDFGSSPNVLNLLGDVTLAVAGPALTLSGTVTINGPGVLINESFLDISSDAIHADVDNRGTLRVSESTASIHGGLSTRSASVIQVIAGGTTFATLNVSDGFTNHGRIELIKAGVRDEMARLAVSSGTLTNGSNAVIQSSGGSGAHVIDALLINQGTIDVDQNLLLDNEARIFTSTDGRLDVAAGKRFSISGGATEFGASTVLQGTGTIDFVLSGTVLNLLGDVTSGGGTPSLAFSGFVTVNGLGTLINSGFLDISRDTLNAALDNRGVLLVSESPATINGDLRTAAGSTIQVRAGGVTFASLTVAEGFTNNGRIDLFKNGVRDEMSRLTINSGTLSNGAEGEIFSRGGSGTHMLDAVLLNQGRIYVDQNLSITKLTQTDGSTQVGSRLLSSQTIELQGGELSGAGTVSAAVNHTGGRVAPGQPLGTLALPTYTQASGGSLNVELGGTAAGSYDQLRASGSVDLAGTLNVTVGGGFYPDLGDQFLIVDKQSTGAIGGVFAGLPQGSEVVVGDFVFQITYAGGNGNDVLLTTTAVPDRPTAVLQMPPLISYGEDFTLDGTASSDIAPGSIVTYRWSLFGGSEVIETTTPTLTVDGSSTLSKPAGIHEFSLVVIDNDGYSSDTAVVTAELRDTTSPIAVLEAPLVVDVREDFVLDCTASSDAVPGQIVIYRWSLFDGQQTIDTDTPTLMVAPSDNPAGTGSFMFALQVVDDSGNLSSTVQREIAFTSTVQWDGEGLDNDWKNPVNWSDDVLPTAADDVIIGSAFSGQTIVMDGADVSVRSVTSVATLTIGDGSFTLGRGVSTIDDTLTIDTGILRLNGATIGGSGSLVNDGTVIARELGNVISLRIASSRFLRVESVAGQFRSDLTIAEGFSSDGAIELTTIGSAPGAWQSELNVTSGTLLINETSSFRSSAADSSGAAYVLRAQLQNSGSITIDHGLTIDKPDADHFLAGASTLELTNGDLTVTQIGGSPSFVSEGAIDVGAGRTLAITGSDLRINSGGSLSGSGTVVADVDVQGGSISPGPAAARLTIDGDYTQAGGTLVIEIGGSVRRTEHDWLNVIGEAVVGGDLVLSRINDFSQLPGQSFPVLTAAGVNGSFDNDNGAGIGFTVEQNSQDIRVVGVGDFGDARDVTAGTGFYDYQTLAANNGPAHTVDSRIFLGATVDGEADGQPTADANGDDVNGPAADDEDGVVNPTTALALRAGDTPSIDVVVTNNTGRPATLAGWIDYNADGVFDHATESATTIVPDGSSGITVSLIFPQIPAALTATTFARFRITSDPDWTPSPTGPANST